MGKVNAGITVSVDGFITGPGDGPGCGLGVGGERLHEWVFGGPWSYADETRGAPAPEDAAWLDAMVARCGAIVVGRGMYEAAGRWGDENPWGPPCFVVTHRVEDHPAGDGFVLVDGVASAVARARETAGDRWTHIGGGADVIRQALAAGLVDELTLIVAPVVLGAGKRLFDGFDQLVELEQLGVRQSPHATFLEYRVLG